MTITARIGLPGEFVDPIAGSHHYAQVDKVNSATSVEANTRGGIFTCVFIQVGDTPPATKYFIATDYTAP